MYINSATPGQQSKFQRRVQSIEARGASMTKQASLFGYGAPAQPVATLGGGQVNRMAMKPFSPLYQESNLMLPKERKTMNAYNRHYYETDYWVGNIIDLHTYYPLGGFDIISKDKAVERVMRKAAEKVDLLKTVLGVGLEYWVYGEAFPFFEWDKNEQMWGRATIFNPDLMEVRRTVFVNKPIISLVPDAELKRIATSTNPADAILREQIPRTVLEYVLRGQNIPLSSRSVSHLLKQTVPHDLRGTSIIQRVWKELMLRDAFREVLFVIAQNHITPLKIFKIGGKDKDYYPDQSELAAWQGIIEEAQNDPNFSIITHEALDVDYKGASGQIVDVTKYLEIIENNVLTGLFANKTMTSGDGPCVIKGTEVLTKEGFKKIEDCTCSDEVGSVNPETGVLEYCKPTQKLEFDVTGPMHHFKSGMLDHCVTPNHRCWVKSPTQDTYGITLAEDVRSGYKFKSVIGWSGMNTPLLTIANKLVDTNKYLKFIGLYLSEGSLEYNSINPHAIRISQTEKHKFEKNPRYDAVKAAVLDFCPTAKEYQREYTKGNKGHFAIYDTEFAKHTLANYSEGSASKQIPTWVKALASEHLENLLQGCFLGDGSNYGKGKSYEIYTISRRLADDLQEIALKCGYATKVITKTRDASRQPIYRVIVLVSNIKGLGREPEVRSNNIKTFNYTGKVYSFDLPINRIYVTRRNGLITITGNTYAASQVAYEILQKRYVYFRNLIEQWLKWKFFRPISVMHGFKTKDGEYATPQIKWTRMDFSKDEQWRAKVIELNQAERPLISDRTIATEMGFDYDEEQSLIAMEKQARIAANEKAKQPPAAAGGAGAMGGMGGGLGDLGGGGGGMSDLGGGGLGDLGGGMPEMGGAAGGADLGGGIGGPPAGGAGGSPTSFASPAGAA